MIEVERQFFRRLNHQRYGLSELVALHKDTGRMIATGFFDNADDFVYACCAYNAQCNVYAGRNPRPWEISLLRNSMDTVKKKRAKDKEIKHLTAVSLDIDPIRKKGIASTKEQRQTAIRFALDLQWDLGGDVDDSGNGAYLWIPFVTPIEISQENFYNVKKQCQVWQVMLREKYKPGKYGLKIDGCFDFSRLKRVIGTFNHKAQRISKFVKRSEADDKVRNEILSIEVDDFRFNKFRRIPFPPIIPSFLPDKFKSLLGWNFSVRNLWKNPDPLNA